MTDPGHRPEGDEDVYCGVCRRVLDHGIWFAADGSIEREEFTHTDFSEGMDADHEPLPVSRQDMVDLGDEPLQFCDFCLVPDPAWYLPVEDFVMWWVPEDDDVDHWNRSDWACCDECAELLRKGYWDRLIRRVARIHHDRDENPNKASVAARIVNLRKMYGTLTEHVLGVPYPNPHRGGES